MLILVLDPAMLRKDNYSKLAIEAIWERGRVLSHTYMDTEGCFKILEGVPFKKI